MYMRVSGRCWKRGWVLLGKCTIEVGLVYCKQHLRGNLASFSEYAKTPRLLKVVMQTCLKRRRYWPGCYMRLVSAYFMA
jgi:hypothetical protein